MRFATGLVLFAALSASAEEPAPDAKKIVDVFVGRWLGTGALSVHGAAPAKFEMELDCRRAAQGRVAACVQGQPITVTLVAELTDARTMFSRSVTTLPSGGKIVLEGVAKRR
jgi:hypothetical protein